MSKRKEKAGICQIGDIENEEFFLISSLYLPFYMLSPEIDDDDHHCHQLSGVCVDCWLVDNQMIPCIRKKLADLAI